MSFLQLSHKTTSSIIVGGMLLGYALMLSSGRPVSEAYLIQGQDLTSVQAAVQAAGGQVTHELGIINAVGAMSDNYTPADPSDDVLASFSSAGPTVEGFVKPELVAPGGHMSAISRPTSKLAKQHPEFHDQDKYFTMSGTSQAAAVVSGVVTLMLQADPSLTPNEVKCRLIASARPALDVNGELAYSPLQQGAGQVNAYDAVYSTATGCANRGMDVSLDLDDIEHYGGPVNQYADGSYYLRDPAGSEYNLWNGDYVKGDGYLWADNLSETASVNNWVSQE